MEAEVIRDNVSMSVETWNRAWCPDLDPALALTAARAPLFAARPKKKSSFLRS